ncbi:MAG TPA: aminotransferase class V-fold PLP-dependent enzyme [Acidimicrobiales bacterium]|nr:aminotransferase class V-fold PLP-dependent enzyme [Acidimicrobiales bacterium]
MTELPEHGVPRDEVLERLEAMRARDVDWRSGRAFTLAYHPGEEILELQADAFVRFMDDNGLNPDAFPSSRQLQTDVVSMVCGLLDGGPDAAGFLTTGGTESLLMAVTAARERGRRERGIERPQMVLPTTAHAAFEKAAHYFGVESVRIPVRDDYRADPDAMADAVTDRTVLIVGSAPQYPQGVIDPIESIASLAADRGISCHVDACMGGITLPMLERLGYSIPTWSFRVPGVTSISVDLHKYGYTAKGASVIAHRTRELRADQTFFTDSWLGGAYGSSAILGTKSVGPWAAAWAVMQHLGHDGYLRLTADARRATEQLIAAVRSIPGLVVRGEPDATLVAFGSDDAALDVFAIGDGLLRRGWYLDRQGPPPSLHATVNAVHAIVMNEFVADLRSAAEEARSQEAHGSATAYGSVE